MPPVTTGHRAACTCCHTMVLTGFCCTHAWPLPYHHHRVYHTTLPYTEVHAPYAHLAVPPHITLPATPHLPTCHMPVLTCHLPPPPSSACHHPHICLAPASRLVWLLSHFPPPRVFFPLRTAAYRFTLQLPAFTRTGFITDLLACYWPAFCHYADTARRLPTLQLRMCTLPG